MTLKARAYCMCFISSFSEKVIDIGVLVSQFLQNHCLGPYWEFVVSVIGNHVKVTKVYVYQALYVTFIVGKNKKLVFKLIFIIVSEAYLTLDGESTIWKQKMEII